MRKHLFLPLVLTIFSIAASAQYATLDSTFGTNGFNITYGDSGASIYATCMALQPNGRIVTGGRTVINNIAVMAITRYMSNGAIDSTFATNGILKIDSGGIYSIALQADGKIVCAGVYRGPVLITELVLLRCDSNGVLDNTFGTGGIVIDTVSSLGTSVALQPDGKIVVTGQQYITGAHIDYVVARYMQDGQRDNSFGTNGAVITPIPGSQSSVSANAVLIQPDGKIVAGGTEPTTTGDNIVFARYDSTGQLDINYGSNGLATFGSGQQQFALYAMALQPDLKIVAVGIDGKGVLIRMTASGLLDTTFAGTLSAGVGNYGYQFNTSVVLTPSGDVITGGWGTVATSNITELIKYNSNGNLDTSFARASSDNIVEGSFNNSTSQLYAMALQPDGKILIAGSGVDLNGNYGILVARYLPDDLDSSLNCTADSSAITHIMCQGDTFSFGSGHLTSSGTYVDTLTNVGGCDSIVILTLTVNALPVVSLSWDSLVSKYDLYSFGLEYGYPLDTFWCMFGTPNIFPMSGGMPLGGVYSGTNITNDTFNIMFTNWGVDTVYYTYTDQNGCSAIAIDSFGIEVCEGINNISGANSISLYPNPNHGSFTLSSSNSIGSDYTISDMLGDVIAHDVITANEQAIEMKDASEGVYTLIVNGAKPVRFVVLR